MMSARLQRGQPTIRPIAGSVGSRPATVAGHQFAGTRAINKGLGSTSAAWHWPLSGLLGVLLCSSAGSSAPGTGFPQALQEQSPPRVEPQEESLDEILDEQMGTADPQAEIQELFNRIEKNLRAIDNLLFEAAASEDVALENAQEWRSWIVDSKAKSQEVLDDIDKLLEVAQQMSNESRGRSSSSQGQGRSSSESSEQGQSPLDQQRDSSQRRQEGSGQPQSGNESQNQSGQEPGEGQPQGGTEGQEPTTQGQPKDAGAGGDESQRSGAEAEARGQRGSGSDAAGLEPWGELPPRVQEIFSNQNSQDAPLLYRDWIDSYYRRVARQP
jgi:hypothetical protein